jgi:anti-sigma factor RsiW
MFDRFDEAALLAYIEDEMSPEQSLALESRLRDEPQVREVIERMREDRALLRSMGQPLPRIDFVAELEPQLARPMLIEPRPGSYRRQRHRRVRVARVRRYAAAAAVILIVGGGLWMVLAATGVSPRAWIDRQMARDGSPAPAAIDGTVGPELIAGNGTDQTVPAPDHWPPAGEAVHHWGPLPSVARSRQPTLARQDDDVDRRVPGEATPTLHPAAFAIVLRGDDETATQVMERGLRRLGSGQRTPATEPLALVRNFSFDEARAMIEEFLVNAPAGSLPEPLRAALDPDGPTVSVKDRPHVRRSLANGLRAARASEDEPSRQKWSRRLLGSEAFAPDYERQLDFSSRGAVLTASVPVARLETLLDTLFVESAGSMTLRVFGNGLAGVEPGSPVDTSETALQRWLRDLTAIRKEITELRRMNPDAQVLVPVVVEPVAAR